MQNLIRGANGKMVFLIVDNLRVHHSLKVQEWLKKNFDKIKVFYLPAYCPDLNADEYLNHLIKQEFHSRIRPKNKNELAASVRGILRKLQRCPKKIKSIFNKTEVKYAA
jgi:transposase